MSQLVWCALIIFSIGLIQAEENINEYCYNQWVIQSRLESICMAGTVSETEFLNAVNVTLVEYSGDDEAVRSQSDEYCPLLYGMIDCTLIGYDLDERCVAADSKAKQHQLHKIAHTLLNYMCANRSEAILQILQNGGLETIIENEKSKECARMIDGIKHIDEETLGVSSEFCEGMDKMYACYLNMVRDHKNKNLFRIAGELNELHRKTLKCPSANQL